MKKISPILFKLAMSKFATGVTIITINKKNKYIGKTVNSFASLSLNPPLILFSLDKQSSSLNEFITSKYLGINILSKKQKKLSDYFSKKNCEWGDTKFFLSNNNIPLIKDSVLNIDSKKVSIVKKGDHIIVICQILQLKIDNQAKPLIYLNSSYQ